MARSCSDICYASLMMTSNFVVLIFGASLTFTIISSCIFTNKQIDIFISFIWYFTKILLCISIVIMAFLFGARIIRIQKEKEKENANMYHAAILQAATRRRLSMMDRSNPSPANENFLPLRRRTSQRIREKTTRLGFDTPMPITPLARRNSESNLE